MLSGTEILTTAQMRAIESAAMDSGAVTGLQLMERAGAAVAGEIRLRWPKPGRVTVLCGPGNNGGDGYVIARLLHRAGWQVRVLGQDNQPGADAAEMKRRWSEIGRIEPLTLDALRNGGNSDVYVDAIFGTGLTRPPEGVIEGVIRHLGGYGGDSFYYRPRLVAVDCPSGLCLDSGAMLGRGRGPASGWHGLRARVTIAFDSPKTGHLLDLGPESCGDLVIADIGLHQWRVNEKRPLGDGSSITVARHPVIEALWPPFDIADDRRLPGAAEKRAAWLQKREGGSHKYSHGHALIVAGGVAKGGAARLSARAALRIGAGLVTLAPPQEALPEHTAPPDALMRCALDDAAALRDLLDDTRITAVCIGPGCGIDRAASLLPVLLASRRPAVLDADALTALAREPRLAAMLHPDCVLTPHAGEFARLAPDLAARLSDRPVQGPAFSKLDAAREIAARLGAVVLLKGPDTVIASPDGRCRIHSAFDLPWLATAGSGDVLAGLIAGLLARSLPALDAAGLGTALHAAAARSFGPGLIADDLPDRLPALLRDPPPESARTRPGALL